jgi:cysteine peptidase C11 family protein
MLLDNRKLYRNGFPPALQLGWDDFECGLSEDNEGALGHVAEWAVLAYMAADCNLAPYMFDDLWELKLVGSNKDVHVLAMFDGPLLTDSFFARLNPNTPLGQDIILRFGELRSSEASTISLALQLASAYPAKRRLLLLGGHGQCWKGALLDQNIGLLYRKEPGRLFLPGAGSECDARLHACLIRTQARLNLELEKTHHSQTRYDILAFDACYMGCAEAVAEFAHLANLLVVSEDQVPGDGFAYSSILGGLVNNPAQSPLELASSIVTSTNTMYRTTDQARQITLAALAADQMSPFAETFIRLVQALDTSELSTFSAVRYALENAWKFDATGAIDLRGFVMNLLNGELTRVAREAATAVLDSYSKLVVAFAGGATAATTNGLSIYAPAPADFDVSYMEASNHLRLDFGIWALFLGGYYLQLLGAEAPEHPLIQAIVRTMQDLRARGIYKP